VRPQESAEILALRQQVQALQLQLQAQTDRPAPRAATLVAPRHPPRRANPVPPQDGSGSDSEEEHASLGSKGSRGPPSALKAALGKAPTFNGEGNIRAYLQQFDLFCTSMCVPASYRTTVLSSALRGIAAQHLHAIPGFATCSYPELTAHLLDLFGRGDCMYRSELMGIRRKPGRPVSDYIAEFRALHAKANVADVAPDIQVRWFV